MAPGGTVTLWADVTPNAKVHVYAQGAKDVMPVSLVLTPHADIMASKARYPRATLMPTVGVVEPVPAYTETFRITQPVAVARAARSGARLTLAASLNYQACDDKVCYPSASLPVFWTLTVQ